MGELTLVVNSQLGHGQPNWPSHQYTHKFKHNCLKKKKYCLLCAESVDILKPRLCPTLAHSLLGRKHIHQGQNAVKKYRQ